MSSLIGNLKAGVLQRADSQVESPQHHRRQGSEGGQLLPESVAWYSRRGNLGVAWAVAWRCLALPGVAWRCLGLAWERGECTTVQFPGSICWTIFH